MAFRSHVITEEKAKGVRKVLRWIKEAAPRKREREEAESLLRVLEGVRGTKQILLTRGQEEMLSFITEEFPITEPVQLSLFSPQEEHYMSQAPTQRRVPSKSIRPDQKLPGPHPITKPRLKGELTEEDKEARRRIGLHGTPGKVPLDTTGTPLSKRIAEIQESTAIKERQFGKVKEVK